MAISKKIRLAVYQKYAGHCAYCGRRIEYKDMQVDHLVPQASKGIVWDYDPNRENRVEVINVDVNDISNLMPACRLCNHYKRAESLESFRRQIETIPQKLAEYEYIYRVGVAYGFYDSKPRNVTFYYEEVEEGEQNG